VIGCVGRFRPPRLLRHIRGRGGYWGKVGGTSPRGPGLPLLRFFDRVRGRWEACSVQGRLLWGSTVNVLVVEDEPAIREGLVDLLRGAGHEVMSAPDGKKAIAMGRDPAVKMILLDLMLPGIDGLDVCRRLKAARPDLYVLMLTARGSEDDKVNGLKTGADDYITKPFGPRELLARIEAVERRLETAETLEVDGCLLDLGRCVARRDGEDIGLTARETLILRLLFNHRGRAVPRSELLERIWDAPGDLETRTVDMTISNLRQKIEREPSRPGIVVTVKGVGYAWGPGL